jgi:hypothetical protein
LGQKYANSDGLQSTKVAAVEFFFGALCTTTIYNWQMLIFSADVFIFFSTPTIKKFFIIIDFYLNFFPFSSLPPAVLGEKKLIKDLSINNHHSESTTVVPETKDLHESLATSNIVHETGSCSTQSPLRNEPFQDSSCDITQAG